MKQGKVLTFMMLAFLLATTGQTAGQQTGTAPSTPSGLSNIRFQNDVRVFTVMAALNLAGFDLEAQDGEISSVRRDLRAALVDVDPDLVSRLRTFYQAKLKEGLDPTRPQIAYTSLALLLSGPPEFSLDVPEADMPGDAWLVRGFESLAAEVYQKGQLFRLWEEYLPQYKAELAVYEPLLREEIVKTLAYFRVPARIYLDREILLTVDLLDVKNIVNARNQLNTYAIVVGPSDNPSESRSQLRHEYLHFLVDALVRRYSTALRSLEDFLDVAQSQPHVRSDYQNKFILMVTESLIEAIQLRIDSPETDEALNKELVRLFRRGLVFAPQLFRSLQEYERMDQMSLPVFLESRLVAIQRGELQADIEKVGELERYFRELDAEAIAARQEELLKIEHDNQVHEMFSQASRLLSGQDYGGAKAQLEELLEIEPEYGNAHFYLGQISVQNQAYPEAFDHYRRAADAPDVDGWVRAWSLLRMGRLRAAEQDFEAARGFFNDVLKLDGELRGAREAAKESLDQLPAQQ